MQVSTASRLLVSLALPLCAAHRWQQKAPSEWTETDARQVLSDSPWSKQVSARSRGLDSPAGPGQFGDGIHGSVGGTVGTGGMRSAGGAVGGALGPPGLGGPDASPPTPDRSNPGLTLTVRWESASPVRQALLKLGAPVPAAGEYYTIALAGLPEQIAALSSEDFKRRTSIKLKDKRQISPEDVRILLRDGQPVVLLLFCRSQEIAPADKEVEFSAQFGIFELRQKFALKQMTFEGKLEL